MRRVIRTIISGTVLLTALLATVALADVKSPATETAHSSAGMDQLMRMASFLAQLKQLSVAQQSGYDVVQDSGQKIEFLENRKLVFDRPDRFRVDAQRSNGESYAIAFDGQAITVFSLTKKLYASSKIKGDIDSAITYYVKDLGMRFPLAMLYVINLPDEFGRRVREAEIVETLILNGVSYFHLVVRADNVDFQVLLPETGDPLPLRIVITYKFEVGQPQYWANFSNWNLSPNPPESSFFPNIPKDADRIQFFAEPPIVATPPIGKGEKK